MVNKLDIEFECPHCNKRVEIDIDISKPGMLDIPKVRPFPVEPKLKLRPIGEVIKEVEEEDGNGR